MSAQECSCQLMAYCEQDLESDLFQYNPDIASKPEKNTLRAIKELAVADVAATVRVRELLRMKQQHGEGVRTYTARVRGKANICALEKSCTCRATVNYPDEIVRVDNPGRTLLTRHIPRGSWDPRH